MPRGAPARVLDDVTDRRGPRIDVAVRIGWTARMARLTGPGGARTMQQVAAAVGSNQTRLNRLETGAVREGALLDAYEAALGVPAGSLRAPVDVICRCFPYSPVDADPDSRHLDVRAVSRLTERVRSATPTGGDWLVWARAMARPGAVGMPEDLALDLLRRLASELGRTQGHGYATRYEALSLVRCSGYGHLVLEVAQQVVADPDVQVLLDLLSAVGEAPDREATAWCLALLDDPRDQVLTGGALGLENMAQVSGRPLFWADLVDPLLERVDAAEPGSSRRAWLSHLVRLVPPELQATATVPLRQPLEPLTAAAARTRGDEGAARADARDWRDCRRRAHDVTDALDLPEQPVLARLLWEMAHSPLETRAVTAYFLLTALPSLAGPVGEHVADLAEHHPDPHTRARCARRLVGVAQHAVPAPVRGWLTGPDGERRAHAVRVMAHLGERADHDVLRGLLADEATRAAAVYAAGMTADPLLDEAAADPAHPAAGAARWWLREGSAVDDTIRRA